MHAGTKRPSLETADDSSRFSMREIRMGGATKNQRHGVSVICCSPVGADSRRRFFLFDPNKSSKQTTLRHPHITENQKNLSGEAFR